jgi:CRP-like cAMP-binding protein
MKTNSHLSWYLHQMHSHEFYDHVAQVAQMGCLPARQRLEHFLKELISALGPCESRREIRLHLPLKLWEIAELIAVTPEHLSRMLNHMEKEGTIRRNKGWIILSDIRQLCSLHGAADARRAARPVT